MAGRSAGVAVIIPAHNSAATIDRAVASALAEREAEQVIVIDDGSWDGTLAAAREADDGSGRLVLLRNDVAGGPAQARNLAIRAAQADWLCPLDADDYFRPGRLGRLLARSDGVDFIADDLVRVVQDRPDLPEGRLIGSSFPLPCDLDLAAFARANVSRRGRPRAELGFLKPLMRRAFLTDRRLAYDERLRLGEDFILYAKALALGARFRIVEACGYVAVERSDSLSGRHTAADLRNLAAASAALSALPLPRDQAAALREHHRHVRAKQALREFLDAKRAKGILGGAAALARSPASTPYVLATAVADKLVKARAAAAQPTPA
jgi:succinoglycan biosynthesis protein ExoU